MEGKDTEQVPDRPSRDDDRNELVEGSPVPDPEDEQLGADDVPEAD
jgi:hypothetical protein